MKKYTVVYTEVTSIQRKIEAKSKKEAEQKMLGMVAAGEIDLSFAELEENKAEVIGEE